MSTHEQEAQYPMPSPDALELNKETLGDLDVEPSSADQIQGGAITTSSTTFTMTDKLTRLTDACTKK